MDPIQTSNDVTLAERAREARRAVGDTFLSSPNAALGSICDFCPNFSHQIDALAAFLRSPAGIEALNSFKHGMVPNQLDGTPHGVWSIGLMAYACGLSEDVPVFAVASDSSADEAVFESSRPDRQINIVYYAAAIAAICLAALIVLNARGTFAPRTKPSPPPFSAAQTPVAPVPATPSNVTPPFVDDSIINSGRTNVSHVAHSARTAKSNLNSPATSDGSAVQRSERNLPRPRSEPRHDSDLHKRDTPPAEPND